MLCEICGKEEATIQLTSTGKKHKNERWICKNCASEHFYFQDDQMNDKNLDQEFVVNQFLQYLVGKHGINFKEMKPQEEKRCPTCGMTLPDIAKVGKFGCHDCFETFRDDVPQIIRRVQAGSGDHTGKIPASSRSKIQLKQQIAEKEKTLQNLIEEQAFEEAAVVRDEIKSLKEEGEFK